MLWLLNRLVFHLFVVLTAAGLTLLSASLLGSIWGFALMALLWIPLMVTLPWVWTKMTQTKITVHWIMFLLVMLPIAACATQFPGLLTLLRMDHIRKIPASEITRYPGEFAFEFSDGIVQSDYQYLRIAKSYDSRKSTTTTSYYLVAPITGKNWTPQEPITAWAVCAPGYSSEKDCEHWSVENGVAVQCDEQGKSAFEETVKQACVKKQLKSVEGARMLIWSSSIETEKNRRLRIMLAAVSGTWAGWGFLYIIIYLFRGKKMREEALKE